MDRERGNSDESDGEGFNTKTDNEYDTDGIVFIEDNHSLNFPSKDSEGPSKPKEMGFEDEFGLSEVKELKHTLQAISKDLIPTIMIKLEDYKKIYAKSFEQNLRSHVVSTLQEAHNTDNEVIRQISDEYLNMDDEVLALSSLESYDIRDKTEELKQKIIDIKQSIAQKRLKLKQFQTANHLLKTKLVKFFA